MDCNFSALACGGISDLQAYQPGKPIEEVEREYGISHAAKLASNENPLGPSPLVLETLRGHIDKNLALYPDGGAYRLKQALAAKLGVAPQQITVSNGSNEVLELVARVFTDASHSLMYSQYAFLVYPLVAKVIGARAIEVPAKDWGHDLEAMQAAVTADTRVIFIANPNNPTGTWLRESELRNFLDKVPGHVIVVLDEAYFEYVDEADYPDTLKWLPEYPNLVVTRTFSKAYGLAGLRIGYAVSHAQIADLLNRAREPFNVNSLALIAAETALQDETHLQFSVKANRVGLQQLTGACVERGWEFIPSVGNFFCLNTQRNAAQIYDSLLRRGLIVRPVANYQMPQHLRISVGLEEQNVSLINALEEILR